MFVTIPGHVFISIKLVPGMNWSLNFVNQHLKLSWAYLKKKKGKGSVLRSCFYIENVLCIIYGIYTVYTYKYLHIYEDLSSIDPLK